MKRRAFTLTELLVVVGIVVLLLSLLLPTLGRARAMAAQTACLSKLHQLGVAMTAYLADSEGYFPRPAEVGAAKEVPEDWIWWQTARRSNGKLQGALVKYAGIDEAAYKCPAADDDEKKFPDYPFSYSINEDIAHGATRATGKASLHLRQVKKPADKILFIDEAGATSDDGAWMAEASAASRTFNLGARHSRKETNSSTPEVGTGNVCFADMSARLIERAESIKPARWDAEFE